jgi:hypothetical protein
LIDRPLRVQPPVTNITRFEIHRNIENDHPTRFDASSRAAVTAFLAHFSTVKTMNLYGRPSVGAPPWS